MKYYIKAILFALLPAILLFIGRWDSLYSHIVAHNFNITKIQVEQFQLALFILGIVLTTVITPVQLAHTKIRLEKLNLSYIHLLEYSKSVYVKVMKESVGKPKVVLNTRIFVPQKGVKAYFERRINKTRKYKIKEIEGVSDPFHANDLIFEVNPSVQGLVGKTYQNKKGIIDCEVNTSDHNLSPYLKILTEDVRFCSTMPILNQKDDVRAVLTIDSDEEVKFEEKDYDQWKKHMRYYCAFIDKHVKL